MSDYIPVITNRRNYNNNLNIVRRKISGSKIRR